MKKRTLIVAALLSAMTIGANAQDNLALGKTVVASSNPDITGNLVDGKYNTGWEVSGEKAENLDTGYWFYIDLGSKQKFNTLSIRWETASSHKFDIYTADALGEDGTPQFGEEPACSIDQKITNISQDQIYNVGDLEAQYIKVKARVLDYGGGYWHLFEVGVYNISGQTLTDINVPTIIETGKEFTITATDQLGREITPESVEATNATKVDGKDNTFIANNNGMIEVTVKNGEVTKTAKIWAVSPSIEKPTLKATDLSFFDDSLEGLTEYGKGWEGGYGSSSVIDFKGNKVIDVTQAVTYGFLKSGAEAAEYKSLNFDIYPSEDIKDAYVVFEGAGLGELLMPELKANQWNHVSLDVTGATNFSSYIKFKFNRANPSHENATLNILLDNVYLSMGDVEIVENVTVAQEPNARGFYTVSGYAKSAATVNAQLTDENITAYDLTKLKTEGEGYTLTPANPNALIYVNGNGGNDFEPALNWGETKNIIGFNGNSAIEWYKPTTSGVNFVDGYAVYQGGSDQSTAFISATNDRPVSYTRSLPAGKYVSTFLPTNAEVPAGCKAYKFIEGSDANTIGFEEVTTLAANTPYVIYNGNAENVALTFKATGDVYFTTDKETETTIGNATVKGNFSNFAGDGTQYVLDANSYDEATGTLKLKKCTEKTTIVPFRVYFTVNEPSQANNIKFMLPGNTTGINDINANTQTAADIYSIDGRLVKRGATSVKGLANGVYIMNGKKYVVK